MRSEELGMGAIGPRRSLSAGGSAGEAEAGWLGVDLVMIPSR